MNPDFGCEGGQGTEIPKVAAKDIAARLGDCNDQGVDGRSCPRLGAQGRGASGDAFRDALDDLAGLEKAVDVRVCALLAGEALHQHDRGHDRRPETLPPKRLDPREGVGVAAGQSRHPARVEDEGAQTAFRLLPRALISTARRSARRLDAADGWPTSLASSSM